MRLAWLRDSCLGQAPGTRGPAATWARPAAPWSPHSSHPVAPGPKLNTEHFSAGGPAKLGRQQESPAPGPSHPPQSNLHKGIWVGPVDHRDLDHVGCTSVISTKSISLLLQLSHLTLFTLHFIFPIGACNCLLFPHALVSCFGNLDHSRPEAGSWLLPSSSFPAMCSLFL